MARLYSIEGRVQGVGFRPAISRLARRLELRGEVRNHAGKVEVFLEGSDAKLQQFELELAGELPLRAQIRELTQKTVDDRHRKSFDIVTSSAGKPENISLTPDLATCDRCLEESFDPDNRRYFYLLPVVVIAGRVIQSSKTCRMTVSRQQCAILKCAPIAGRSMKIRKTDAFMPKASAVPNADRNLAS